MEGKGELAFGHEAYAKALFERIRRQFAPKSGDREMAEKLKGEPALVAGLYGEWGCGKTMWLKRIEALFEGELKKEFENRQGDSLTVPVFFNAWRFEKEDHLVVPLLKSAQETLSSFTAQGGKGVGTWFRKRAKVLGEAVVAIAQGLKGKLSVPFVGDLEWNVGATTKAAIDAAEKSKRAEAAAIDAYSSMYFDLIGYLEALTGRARFQKRRPYEKRIRNALVGWDEGWKKLNLVFLIDDLDRCLPEKAVEMLEAIKLFLEVEGCAFVLGLDDVVVDRGIAHRYKDYLFESRKAEKGNEDGNGEDLAPPISGMEYLEKIIHLPVRVPAMTKGEARKFLEKRYRDVFAEEKSAKSETGALDEMGKKRRGKSKPAEDAEGGGEDKGINESLLNLFIDKVPPVPRKLVRAVELFHLHREIADQRPNLRLQDGMLARMVFLQLFAPELFRYGKQKPEFLRTIWGWRTDDEAWDVAAHWKQDYGKRLKAALEGEKKDPKMVRAIEHEEKPLRMILDRCRNNRSGFDPYSILPDPNDPLERELRRLEVYYAFLSHEVEKVEVVPPGTESGPKVVPKPAAVSLDGGRLDGMRSAFSGRDRGRWLEMEKKLRSDLGGGYLDEAAIRVLEGLAEARIDDKEGAKMEWLGALVNLVSPEVHRGSLTEKIGLKEKREELERVAFLEASAPAEERQKAAVEYDRVWRREGTGVAPDGKPDLEWVDVPKGFYPNGSGEKDKDAQDRERPTHWVEVAEDFEVMRYPVTVAQFEAFVEDPDGYADKSTWWKDLEKTELDTLEGNYALATVPRTNVNWNEAVAYGRWLSAKMEVEVRLPTEAEWEAVVRIGERVDGKPEGSAEPKKWPEGWEEEEIPNLINMEESGLRKPSVVGAFPKGRIGEVDDLLGNVWEWCLDGIREYSEEIHRADSRVSLEDVQSGAYRALRGGSWFFVAGHCRPAYRFALHPGRRLDFVGFRLVRVPGRPVPQEK